MNRKEIIEEALVEFAQKIINDSNEDYKKKYESLCNHRWNMLEDARREMLEMKRMCSIINTMCAGRNDRDDIKKVISKYSHNSIRDSILSRMERGIKLNENILEKK